MIIQQIYTYIYIYIYIYIYNINNNNNALTLKDIYTCYIREHFLYVIFCTYKINVNIMLIKLNLHLYKTIQIIIRQ